MSDSIIIQWIKKLQTAVVDLRTAINNISVPEATPATPVQAGNIGIVRLAPDNASNTARDIAATPAMVNSKIVANNTANPITGKAPLPTTSSGIGQFIWLHGTSATNPPYINLPAGGAWVYHLTQWQSSGRAIDGTQCGLRAGGSAVEFRYFGTVTISGFAWRIS